MKKIKTFACYRQKYDTGPRTNRNHFVEVDDETFNRWAAELEELAGVIDGFVFTISSSGQVIRTFDAQSYLHRADRHFETAAHRVVREATIQAIEQTYHDGVYWSDVLFQAKLSTYGEEPFKRAQEAFKWSFKNELAEKRAAHKKFRDYVKAYKD